VPAVYLRADRNRKESHQAAAASLESFFVHFCGFALSVIYVRTG
jgi:hypothetical protein